MNFSPLLSLFLSSSLLSPSFSASCRLSRYPCYCCCCCCHKIIIEEKGRQTNREGERKRKRERESVCECCRWKERESERIGIMQKILKYFKSALICFSFFTKFNPQHKRPAIGIKTCFCSSCSFFHLPLKMAEQEQRWEMRFRTICTRRPIYLKQDIFSTIRRFQRKHRLAFKHGHRLLARV